MPNHHRRAALALLIASVLFSTGGAAIKFAHFTGWQIASLRSGIAGVTLILLVPAARRGWGWRPLLVGAGYAATCICFVLANRLTTSANAIFIQSASPLYVLILGPLLLREPVARRDVLFMVPVGVGLSLFFLGHQPAGATAPDPAAGNLLAVVSGITFAFAVIGFRWLGREETVHGATSLTAAAMGNFLACAVALPMALPLGTHAPGDWVTLLYLGVFQIGLAYFFVAKGVARLPAFEVSVLLLVEPVLNPIWTWAVHGEVPGTAAIAGGTLVLGATVARALWPDRLT
jgi:drug/metabolite transporter (DMT)-like permease